MKILQINNCHYRRGGADIVYLDTSNLLEKYGHQVSHFSTKSVNNLPSEDEKYFVSFTNGLEAGLISKFKLVFRQLYSLEAKRNLQNLIDGKKPDVAHIHLYKGGLTASILSVLKKNNIPTVISLHDFSLLCPRNLFFNADNQICEKCVTSGTLSCVIKRCNRKNLFYSLINFLEYNLNNRFFTPDKYFDKIICLSDFYLKKHESIKLSLHKKYTKLYNFTPYLTSDSHNEPLRGNYYLFYGRLSNEKGVNTLIQAFKGLPQNLKIVGTGDVKIENKSQNIEFLGYKTGLELENLIKNASFILVPSEWYENNPMTIIESYSKGKPVIGSDIGGITELIINKKTGFLFEMGNIEKLALSIKEAERLSEEQYMEMSLNCFNFAKENFYSKTHYEQLINIYNDAIKSKKE